MSDRPPDDSAPDLSALEHLAALLRTDDVDAAIDAGLMAPWPDACADRLDADARALVLATRRRLRTAWDARARFEARNARLAQRAAERDAGRRMPAPVEPVDDAPAPRPALPAGAAALLARAKARAGGGAA